MSDTQYELNYESQKQNRFYTCHIGASTDDGERDQMSDCGVARGCILSYIPVRWLSDVTRGSARNGNASAAGSRDLNASFSHTPIRISIYYTLN